MSLSLPSSKQLSGLLLSRQQLETGFGVDLVFWFSTTQGPCRAVIKGQRYVFLVLQSDWPKIEAACDESELNIDEVRPLALQSFSGEKVTALYSLTGRQSRVLQKHIRQLGCRIFEADISISDRYLMERFIYGSAQISGEFTWMGRYWSCQHATLSPSKVVPSLKVVSLDIECSPSQELYSVGLTLNNSDAQGIFTSTPTSQSLLFMVGDGSLKSEMNIHWCENEWVLLNALQTWFVDFDPDIIIGWSVVQFDMRLLLSRAKLYNLSLNIGRDGSMMRWRAHSNTNSQGTLTLNGRVVLDGIELLKNASLHFDSFSLQFVSEKLLGEGKLDAEAMEWDKGLVIQRQFEQDRLALARYNLQDCWLVERIFRKLKLLEYSIERAQLTGLALDRRGASVAAFSNLYLPLLHRSGYIAPNIGDIQAQHSPGGFVMDSKPGLYGWVLLLDFKSLYPSIIRTFKIDPMGMICGLLEKPSLSIEGFKGARFSREKHHLPAILDKLTRAREEAKKEGNQPFQHAIKIIMNSMYGVLGSAGCRFHDTRLASSITLRGHQIMKDTRHFIEQLESEHSLEVIYGDTDSTFISLASCENLLQAQAQGKVLAKKINNYWTARIADEFSLPSYLEIEFESCFSQFFMPTLRGSDVGSKKRYVGLKTDESGEHLLFKGLESVRSDWTQMAQIFQKQIYKQLFAKQSIDALIINTVLRLKKGELDAQLIYHKRLRRPLQDYVKNIPPQVKAALFADQKNAEKGRPLRYQNTGRIAYLITVNGAQAKEYQCADIDYQHYIDKQLKPIVDALAPVLNVNFEQLISAQGTLF
ncbi:DNA polymerase II [Psychromonas sp. CNPT3]|uniref:DNA polymerase II n=1 Tax=Psychromonas sp. CNPT3 TaxID=314282 RepID=UPI0002C07855|nr:DNA polymerase II [Psychromonas sp. CNPT3]AGH81309.1 DNA polymerase II [Psychromonas sp. CNPT3]